MTPLRAEPTSPIQTVSRLMDVASGLSRQAVVLYQDLAHRMMELGNGPARDAFERIETELRDAGSGKSRGEIADLPTVFHDEDLGATRLATPYAAYSLAVRNQERAFAFWTYVSANASAADVQTEAERLARGELARVKSLRTARRKAFHAGRPPALSVEALRTASTEQLKHQAGETEGALAELHRRIAASLAETGDPRATLMSELAAEEGESARRLGARSTTEQPPGPLPHDPEALVALATERLEAAVELYLAAAEASRREEVVSVAQDLADRGIRRLSVLRDGV